MPGASDTVATGINGLTTFDAPNATGGTQVLGINAIRDKSPGTLPPE